MTAARLYLYPAVAATLAGVLASVAVDRAPDARTMEAHRG